MTARPLMHSTLLALLKLAMSDQPLTAAPIDGLVDAYVVGFGENTYARRSELAELFRKIAPLGERGHFIYLRILGRLP